MSIFNNLNNLGDITSLQFKIEDQKFNLKKDGTKLKVEFTLKRHPSYMVINAYVPSFLIMLMTIVPLYLREEIHFATTITLVLTSLLCSFTLFQSSLFGIPKTAYLKFIDYWNLLALTVILVNFSTLILWEIWQQKKIHNSWNKVKTVMRIGIPLVTLMMVASYWIIAWITYYQR